MNVVGSYEAKTHLPQLLDRVSKGERFIITKHGVPVAELRQPGEAPSMALHQVIEALIRFRAPQEEDGARLSPRKQPKKGKK